MGFLDGILYVIPAVLLAMTVHEYAHAKMAHSLGDNTAQREGRLTLNPLEHVDPLGLLMLIIVRFGWAKPVPINPFNFKGNRDAGIIKVSLAGPLANLALAFVSLVLLRVVATIGASLPLQSDLLGVIQALQTFFMLLARLNLYFMVFNLIPLPPLDGSKILTSVLSPKARMQYQQVEAYAPLILILLLVTRTLPRILVPIAETILSTLFFIVFGII
ncbi:site-2 protease family protein [Proteinivorax hydrogeniformans]|uniref:Site-2 protease family protein n=1 Tax=Proteinivorax hydrogeniformans TaxID=1826727 RepID=A0AAU8HRG2_9FIRM